MSECTHTSDWHKQMLRCEFCGMEYSVEESDRISVLASRPLNFTSEQQAIIARHEAESEEE